MQRLSHIYIFLFYIILSSFYFKFYVLIYRSWMGHKIMSLGKAQMVSRFCQIRYLLEKLTSCKLDLQLFSGLSFLLGLFTEYCALNYMSKFNIKFLFVYLEINECTVNPDICGAGHCVNLPVGYTCICYKGYKLNDQQTKCIGMKWCFQKSELTMLWSAWNVESG